MLAPSPSHLQPPTFSMPQYQQQQPDPGGGSSTWSGPLESPRLTQQQRGGAQADASMGRFPSGGMAAAAAANGGDGSGSSLMDGLDFDMSRQRSGRGQSMTLQRAGSGAGSGAGMNGSSNGGAGNNGGALRSSTGVLPNPKFSIVTHEMCCSVCSHAYLVSS